MRLNRIAALAGFVCATVLVINSARRANLLPETALTHAIAPFGALTGLLTITALYLLIRRTAGTLGLVGYLLNAAGLAGAFAIEYILHFVFPYLGGGVISGLLAGGTGRAFLVTSVVLLAGVLTFSAAAIRSGALPWVGVILYAVGMVPGSLRNVVPVPVFLAGLVVAAVGVAWMSTRLWTAAGEDELPLAPAAARPARA
ncbi:hypothetical protein HII36_35850 [Nonomuraea sp. NN258]|uniref:hypothetical protein n=1 Tax=Nonomuraea antri TaxID=2730852 RepID=UPI00156A1999|nr:hypothetical protein [Nonomuraea antri]NRQ37172.1 hypothetical protein [Nonomuraea antri]